MTSPPPYTPTLKTVPLLLLDIDGTVRHGVDELGRFVNHPDHVRLFPEALTAMRAWKAAGGRIAGISNQGGIALNLVAHEAVGAAMRRTAELAVDEAGQPLIDVLVWCEHHPAAPGALPCWCRKPRTKLIYDAVDQLTVRYTGTEAYPPHLALMVGDRSEDAQCAEAADIQFEWADAWRAAA